MLMTQTYRILAVLIVLATVFALYGQQQVYRYPRLVVDPVPRPLGIELSSGLHIEAEGAYLKLRLETRFRSFQPDTRLRLSSSMPVIRQIIRLENIHPDAVFEVSEGDSARVSERTHGLLREVVLTGLPEYAQITLSWHFPEKTSYRFVAVGDTGGDQELSWALSRASELGADFILHAGDAYYDESEKNRIGQRLNEASIPVYTSNGNHDFLGPNGNAIELFLTEIGPLNASFKLSHTCFINLDTGAFMYPAHKGERAGLLAAEVVNHRRNPTRCKEYVVLTHKPMVDTFEVEFPQRSHALSGADARWIIKQLQQLSRVSLIAGHIHNDFEFEQDGFKTFVSGSGLAHLDLVHGRHVARMLIGDFGDDQNLQMQWALNTMPMEYHCSKKIVRLLEQYKSPKARLVREACLTRP
jgi:hypothetical protein